MPENNRFYIQPIATSTVDNFDKKLLAIECIRNHFTKISGCQDETKRIRSWQKLEDYIKEIFLVYERQVKLDIKTQQYFKNIFEKKFQQHDISGRDTIALIKLLKKYPVKEAAYVLHFYNITYLNNNISDWAKNSPKINLQ